MSPRRVAVLALDGHLELWRTVVERERFSRESLYGVRAWSQAEDTTTTLVMTKEQVVELGHVCHELTGERIP